MKAIFYLGFAVIMPFSLNTGCIDKNDSAPCLTGTGSYSYMIDENSPKGALVGKIPRDSDEVRFRIHAGNQGNTFTINTFDGTIFVQDPALLDYESVTTFTLTVVAEGPECLVSVANVEIRLVDLRNG